MLERVLIKLGNPTLTSGQQQAIMLFIEDATNILMLRIGKEVPQELMFIVEAIAIKHFRRMGSEALSSESVGGVSHTYIDKSDLEPYMEFINDYINKGRSSRLVML